MFQSIIKAFFFGNYFYGVCAVVLSIEANLQQQYPLNTPYYYVLVFTLTVWFYTLAYVTDPSLSTSKNPRTNWYIHQKSFVRYSQVINLTISILLGLYILYIYYKSIAIKMLKINITSCIVYQQSKHIAKYNIIYLRILSIYKDPKQYKN